MIPLMIQAMSTMMISGLLVITRRQENAMHIQYSFDILNLILVKAVCYREIKEWRENYHEGTFLKGVRFDNKKWR
jgi:hypothetical protein